MDEQELTRARLGTYSAKDIERIPEPLREKYFEPSSDGNIFTFRKDLRRVIIFGRHDLIQDAPISHIDLLTCRNSLMYFNSEVQGRILSRFHFALADQGYLVMGKAELMLTHMSAFTTVDLRQRVFQKDGKGNGNGRDRLMMLNNRGDGAGAGNGDLKMREVIFEIDPLAQVVVDAKGHIAHINQRAREQFGLSHQDVGRPLQDLEISYRPVELRSIIGRVYQERRPITEKDVLWPSTIGEPRWFDLVILPLMDGESQLLGAKIVFMDVTRYHRLNDDLLHAKHEVETANEELQATNEELETTNEEMQSTVEELETTNEELQSTNEELETMNEELQSTNEEMETVNDELRHNTHQLNKLNVFLNSILSTVQWSVIVVDHEFNVQLWNHRSEELWGLRKEEVAGKNLLTLDIGLPVEHLRPLIRECLIGGGTQELFVEATNRRGKALQCKVSCSCACETPYFNGAVLFIEDTSAVEA